MKKSILLWLIGVVIITAGCNSNTYSRLRDKEDRLIANYLSRNNYTILTEEPDDNHVWGEKEFYKVKGVDNLYFRLISRGDSVLVDTLSDGKKDTLDLSIVANDVIIARYKRWELTENADTLSYWTTLEQAYPYEFHYLNTTECEAVAWHLAVGLMEYPNSVCEIIVPSKLGFSAEQSTVTPYAYILKINVKP